MTGMNTVVYSPPLIPEEITQNVDPTNGRIMSVSLLLRDAHRKLFSLHVSSETNYSASAAEAGNELDDDPEPVFVLPGSSIEPEQIPNICAGMDPKLLGLFLVEQSE